MIELLKDPRSYCLRERLSRETETTRSLLLKSMNKEDSLKIEFDIGI